MSEMTIAQGLRAAKKLKNELAEIKARLTGSVAYEDGKLPAYAFGPQWVTYQAKSKELARLEGRIAQANGRGTVTVAGESFAMSYAIRQLAEFKSQIALLKCLAVRAQATTTEEREAWKEDEQGRARRIKKDVTIVCALPEAERDRQVDLLQGAFDALNNLVEAANHRIELPPVSPEH